MSLKATLVDTEAAAESKTVVVQQSEEVQNAALNALQTLLDLHAIVLDVQEEPAESIGGHKKFDSWVPEPAFGQRYLD